MDAKLVNEIKKIVEHNIPNWLSVKDCCRISGLSDSSIYRAITRGELKANKKGKWLIKSSWLESYLTS